jgi:hypothetical protein
MLILRAIRKKTEVEARSRADLKRWLVLFAVAVLLPTAVLAGDAIGDLQSRADAWISKSKEVYRLDCDDMKQIWVAYCCEYEVTKERDREEARSVADKMKDDAQSTIKHQLDDYGSLKSDAERLKAGDTESQATKILEAIKVEADLLGKLDKGAWLGANNPLIQFAIEYGKQKHEDMGRSSDFYCDVVDKEIPGGDGRPDCVSARKCMVYEFKPDNDRAKTKGEQQLFSSPNYVATVNQYYSALITKNEKPDSDRGGEDIIKRIHENKECYEGDWPDGGDPKGEIKTKFRGEVKTYRPCENPYQCTNQ